MDGSNEYTSYDPNNVVAFSWTGPMPGQASYTVQPAGSDGTTLVSRLEMQGHGLLRLAEPVLAAGLRRDVEANLDTLKRLLESERAQGD